LPTSGPKFTNPRVGFTPTSPQNEAGLRTEPAPSVPWATAHSPAASAAAAPPLDPPGVHSAFHGLRHVPLSSDDVMLVQNSGTFVLPTITNPASRNLETTGSSPAARRPANTLLERVVGIPATSTTSFTESVTPWNGARSSGRTRAVSMSAAAAARRAPSVSTCTYARSIPS
jgi:hypothetical protein